MRIAWWCCTCRWYDLDQGEQRQQRLVAEWTLAALVQLMQVRVFVDVCMGYVCMR
jgi:hypothetical protein